MIFWKGVKVKKLDKDSDNELEMFLLLEIICDCVKDVYMFKLNDLLKVNCKVFGWLIVFGGILFIIFVIWFYVLEDLFYIW